MKSKQSAVAESHQSVIPWGPVTAIVVVIVIYFLSQILAGVIISIYPLVHHWSQEQAVRWVNSSIAAQFVNIAIIDAVAIWLIRKFLKRRQAGFRLIGLKKPRLKDLGYAIGGFVAYILALIAVFAVVTAMVPGLNFEQRQELGFSLTTSGAALIPVFISLVLLPPIIEEILMRGFLYTSLRSYWGKINAAIITSLLFAAAHLQWGSGNALLWVAAIDTLVLSFVLIYLREKTDGLASPIMLHMLKNGVVFVNLFLLHH